MNNLSKENLTVYTPNRYHGQGVFGFWKYFFNELTVSYPLGWRLFIRDFISRYRQKVLGILWVFIEPVIAVLSFMLLAQSSIIDIKGIEVPYTIYAFLGVTFWGVIQNSITNISGIVNQSGTMILKINFPKLALLISPIYNTLTNLIIRMLLFFVICFFTGFEINYYYLMLSMAALLPTVILGISLGMFLSIIGAVLKDISSLMTYMFQFLLLATPIMYEKPAGSLLGRISEINPFYYLVVVPRDLFLKGYSENINQYFAFSVIGLILLVMAARFYTIAVVRIVEKI